MSVSELILYQTDDGRTAVHLQAEDGTVWLTQAELAELFATCSALSSGSKIGPSYSGSA